MILTTDRFQIKKKLGLLWHYLKKFIKIFPVSSYYFFAMGLMFIINYISLNNVVFVLILAPFIILTLLSSGIDKLININNESLYSDVISFITMIIPVLIIDILLNFTSNMVSRYIGSSLLIKIIEKIIMTIIIVFLISILLNKLPIDT